jgi:hypothetical protein
LVVTILDLNCHPASALRNNVQDMLEFQKEKQARLNEVPVEVALRAHQVQYLDEQRPPLDGSLADALVIPQTSLATLSLRIQVREGRVGRHLTCGGPDAARCRV